jgi:hypothetical protein
MYQTLQIEYYNACGANAVGHFHHTSGWQCQHWLDKEQQQAGNLWFCCSAKQVF